MAEQYVTLAALIKRLMEDGFYGELEVKFKDGKIVGCFKKESLIV